MKHKSDFYLIVEAHDLRNSDSHLHVSLEDQLEFSFEDGMSS
jgi:hypothetical protein